MIKPLISLRFFFSFLVFASHLTFLNTSESATSRWIFDNILYEGFEISFFFILSGFILSLRHQDEFINKTKSLKSFYVSRVARIFPLHLLCLIISIPLTLNYLQEYPLNWSVKLFLNSFLIQSFIPNPNVYFSFNSVSWSISNDIFFCALFPFITVWVAKLSKGRMIHLKRISFLLIIPIAMLLINSQWHHHFFYINPAFRIFDYMVGILLYDIYKKIKDSAFKINYSILEFSSIGIYAIFVFFCHSIPEVFRHSVYYWMPSAFLILSFSFQKGIISEILSKKIFLKLGSISFSLFLIHQLVIKYFLKINDHFFHISNELAIISIMLIISLILSFYSSRYFEKPIGTFIKRKTSN